MYSWRITKYDPLKRDSDGYYLNSQEWTCFSEVGTKVSDEEYLKTEQKYLDAIRSFMRDLSLDSAYVYALEMWPNEDENTTKDRFLSEIQIGKAISTEEVQELARLSLRNEVWCKIGIENHFFVHFGYDFYMYIGADRNCSKAIQSVTQSGLFVEEFESPY